MNASSNILNAALRAYVPSFARPDSLARHLTGAGLHDRQEEITADLDALLATAAAYLRSQTGRLHWTPSFEANYHSFLLERHPWADEATLQHMSSFARWLRWFETLDAPTPKT